VLPALSGLVGRIAAESLTRVPVRAGMTVAAIGYVVAIGVTLAAVIESYVFTAREFVAAVHDGDLIVSAVATEGGWLEVPVDAQIGAAIVRVDGVARVEPARVVPGHHFGTGRVGLLALEPAALARFSPALWRAGDLGAARQALAAGTGVAVSTVFADWYGLAVGDRLTLEAPSAPLTLPIVGVVTDMTSSSGSILLSRTLYAEAWHDHTASRFNVFLAPGVGVEQAAARITTALGDRHRLKIDALAEALAYIDAKVRAAFGFGRSLQLLIVIVAVAGIFDLLFARIFERRRELALWRVVGAADSAVRRSLVVESLTLGALASLVGVPLGVATAWLWVRHILPGLVGYDIELLVPALSCVGTVALVLVATVAAGRAAAASATRSSILDGMRND
jgi:putative ABC transport system permease protein